jgi:hypothetical protein
MSNFQKNMQKIAEFGQKDAKIGRIRALFWNLNFENLTSNLAGFRRQI